MKKIFGRFTLVVTLVLVLVVGQVVSYFASPASYQGFLDVLLRILSMIAFWGPIIKTVLSRQACSTSSITAWALSSLGGDEGFFV